MPTRGLADARRCVMVRLALVVLVSACSYGGSVYAGYGVKHAIVAGVEGGAGVGGLQTNVGIDRLGRVFARLGLAVGGDDQRSSNGPSAGVYPAFLLGAGVVGNIINGEHVDTHFTGVFGAGAVDEYRVRTPAGEDPVCSHDVSAATFQLQLRYTDEVEFVLAGRVDKSSSRCIF
jgi:hypothetical protein